MNVFFFLGAGISYPSHLPSVRQITDSILKEEWSLPPDKIFKKGCLPVFDGAPDSLKHCSCTQKIQELLRKLKDIGDLSRDVKEWGEVHYEELYDLISVLQWDRHGPPSPATRAFCNELSPILREKSPAKDKVDPVNTVDELLNWAHHFIVDVVCDSLKTPNTINGLHTLSEAAEDPGVERLDVATLNHDCLVENYLRKAGHLVADGFGEADGDIRPFDPQVFSSAGARIRLFKLHGSIDWFMFERNLHGNTIRRCPAIATNGDPEHRHDASWEKWHLFHRRPLILVGQWSKWLDYHLYYYNAIMEEFMNALSAARVVVSSGYGWGDWGIKQRLMDWVRAETDRRLVILNAAPKKDRLHPQHPRILQIPQWLSDIHWSDLKNRPGLFS